MCAMKTQPWELTKQEEETIVLGMAGSPNTARYLGMDLLWKKYSAARAALAGSDSGTQRSGQRPSSEGGE